MDYETTYARLARLISRARGERERAYAAVLLIQLRNGARVSEAARAALEWLRTGKSEVEVRVSKSKKLRTRLVVIPPEVLQRKEELAWLLDLSEESLTKRVKNFASRRLKVNTHSLRYAFVTHLLRHGVNPSIVAKITKHSKLDFVLTYTQEKVADDVLRSL